VRRKWYSLTGLILFFIVGYIGYAIFFWNQNTTGQEMIVPGIFFFGAGFVWLTTNISLETATDVRRVTLLEHESISDSLTGIYNRRYLDRRLEEECDRSKRYGLPLSVLLIDIDHFKEINDTYGHQAGDLVLNNLGKLLLDSIRDSDIAARYGGDEMLIIAPNTTLSFAATLAERLRQNIESQPLELNTSNQPNRISITVSIGVAGPNQNVQDCHGLIRNVDEALLQAKHDGRNRVFAYKVNQVEVTTSPI
jgi:diguanylate cyclase (GGDEF)-like protein